MTMTLHCPPDDPCSACFDAQHEADHPVPVEGCFACKLDSITVSAALHAPRATRYVKPRKHDNPWERGVTGTHRRDGSFMPYVNREFHPIGPKVFADNRSRFENQIRQYHAGTPVPVNP
jgi:hypothetical protein